MSGEFVGHEETADEAARQERYAKWEEYMNRVDEGMVTLDEAMSAYTLDMASIGALAIEQTKQG